MSSKNEQKNNSLEYYGISYLPKDKKFCIRFKHNGKYIHVGYFDTESEADKAYYFLYSIKHQLDKFKIIEFPKE